MILLAALVGLVALLIAHFLAGASIIVSIVIGVAAVVVLVLLTGYRRF